MGGRCLWATRSATFCLEDIASKSGNQQTGYPARPPEPTPVSLVLRHPFPSMLYFAFLQGFLFFLKIFLKRSLLRSNLSVFICRWESTINASACWGGHSGLQREVKSDGSCHVSTFLRG